MSVYLPYNFNITVMQRGETKELNQKQALEKYYLLRDYKTLEVGPTGKSWNDAYQEAYEIARAAWSVQQDGDLPEDFNVHRVSGLDKGATERITEALKGRPAQPPRDLKGLRKWKRLFHAKSVVKDPLSMVSNVATGVGLSAYAAARLGSINFQVGKKQIDDQVENIKKDAGLVQEEEVPYNGA